MRREVLGYVKKTTAGLMAAALVLAGTVVSPVSVKAAGNTNPVVYESVDASKFATYWTAETKTAPAYSDIVAGATSDYLFGGWYADAQGKTALDANAAKNVSGTVYAKFVPAYVMGVKVQNASTVQEGKDDASVRMVSSVDCLDYEKVGFEVYTNNKNKVDQVMETTKVYDKLNAGGENLEANKVFGAESKYFAVWRLTGIAAVNFDKILYIRPYWITKDGTKVMGLPKYAHVEDGYKKYVNIPIYLSNVEAAAGVLSVTKPAGLGAVVGVEKGHVFGEMDHAVSGDTVKVVGNVSDITNNANGDDIYVNIRYEAGEYAGVGKGTFLNFTVNGEDFSNKDEQTVTVNVWDVQY